jgi:TolB-like protein/DNA-binding winged helix-turn-helix (wHTH) protein/Tfp pilus assembly protein PilF
VLTRFQFGDSEIDLERYELRRNDRTLKLEKIPMELLVLLVQNRGRLITREEIAGKLWGGEVFVDTEHGINTAIRKIRMALDDDAEQPRFVETVVGKGYRFIMPVEAIAQSGNHGTPTPALAESRGAPLPKGAVSSRASWLWLLGIIAALIMGIYALRWDSRHSAPTRQGKIVLAVLPFQNLSDDPAQEFFAEGMTEEMITQLGRLNPERLGVIARTSVMRFKRAERPLDLIRKELGTDYVLEGSVRREGGRVRITAQLIQVVDQTHLWADTFDRDLNDLLSIQREVSLAVARQIQVALPAGQMQGRTPPSLDPEAYELYLKGRYFWNKRSGESLETAVRHFEESVGRDPNYAPSHSGLADSYSALAYLNYLPPRAAFGQAQAAALKAVQIDDTLAEAHASLAYTRLYYDWNFPEAEREFKRALALNPNYASAHEWYGVFLMAMGRLDEAAAEFQLARQLDPLSLAISTNLGWHSYLARQYDQAEQQLRRTLEMDARFPTARLWLGRTYEQQKKYDQAIQEFTITTQRLVGSPVPPLSLAHAHALAGHAVETEKMSRELRQLAKKKYVPEYGFAAISTGLGRSEQALRELELAFQERSHWMIWMKLDPRLDRLRSDRRFQDLQRRVGLPP